MPRLPRCVDKLCGKLHVDKLCVDKLCVDKLCVDKSCVDKLYVDKLCVDKLCDNLHVDKVCVDKLCVDKSERRRGGGAEPKTRTPHKDVGKSRPVTASQTTSGC